MLKKSYKIIPTPKQKAAFENISEIIRTGGSIGKALIKAGYSEVTSKSPTVVTRTKGFQQLCEETGLTVNMLIEALVYDIKNKPLDRIREIITACRILGLFKADNEQQTQIIDIPDVEFIEIIQAYKGRVSEK